MDNAAAMESDEAMARRMQDEMYGGGGGGGAQSDLDDGIVGRQLRGQGSDEAMARSMQDRAYEETHGVRAPIAAREDVLVGGDDDFARFPRRGQPGHFDPTQYVGNIMQRGREAQPMQFTPFQDGPNVTRAAANGQRETVPARGANALNELFKPPLDLLTAGAWETVRATANERKRWVLANVQDVANFQSSQLNRDTWKNEAVQEVIRQNFVMWQVNNDTDDGRAFMDRYKVTDCPAILFIDPRTGRAVKQTTGFVEPIDMLDRLVSFISEYDFSKPIVVPFARQNKIMRGENDASVAVASASRASADLTEEQMLEQAIAASLDAATGTTTASAAGPSKQAAVDVDCDAIDVEDEVEAVDAPMADEPLPAIRDEPDASASGTTRLQLRMPDGSRVVRRFLLTDSLQTVHDFAAATSGSRNISLVLVNKPIGDLEQTIEAAGAANSALMVRSSE